MDDIGPKTYYLDPPSLLSFCIPNQFDQRLGFPGSDVDSHLRHCESSIQS